jgi:hypothetical protein
MKIFPRNLLVDVNVVISELHELLEEKIIEINFFSIKKINFWSLSLLYKVANRILCFKHLVEEKKKILIQSS